jgi:DNA adenine methylase
MNSILRWAGSKRQLVPKLRAFWPRYVEPFCGSACLFFDLQPKEAILGDLNHELIQMYEAIKCDPRRVIKKLRALPRGKRNYYRIRALDPVKLSPSARAARFLYLNKDCFNGIYRTNTKGDFNVPYGPQKRDAAFDTRAILKAAELLQDATLVAGDFEKTLKLVRAGDFVFIDPPYAVEKRRVFREYHPESFGCDDLERLSNWLEKLDQRGAHFVVSYGDSREARELLKDWNPQRVRTRRNVAGFAANRRNAYELIATNRQGPKSERSSDQLKEILCRKLQ